MIPKKKERKIICVAQNCVHYICFDIVLKSVCNRVYSCHYLTNEMVYALLLLMLLLLLLIVVIRFVSIAMRKYKQNLTERRFLRYIYFFSIKFPSDKRTRKKAHTNTHTWTSIMRAVTRNSVVFFQRKNTIFTNKKRTKLNRENEQRIYRIKVIW